MNDDLFVTLRSHAIRLRYRIMGGEGPAFVLIHGIGGSLETWNAMVPFIDTSYRLIAIDLPGHGMSDKPETVYSLGYHASVVHEFMAVTGITGAVLVGLSLGGGIALRNTIDFHDASKLVLIAGGGLGRELGIGLRIMTLPVLGELLSRGSRINDRIALRSIFYDHSLITHKMVAESTAMRKRFRGRKSFLATLRANADPGGQKNEVIAPIRDALPTIRIPVSIIWGRNDKVIPVEHGIDAAGLIKGACIRIIDKCGHAPVIEKPREVADSINALLRETKSRNSVTGEATHA